MNLLIAADGRGAEIYDAALADAFTGLGHAVTRFNWQGYFHNYPYADALPTPPRWWGTPLASAWYRAQNKFLLGPAIAKLNRDFLHLAQRTQPNVIFLYRGTHLWPRTIATLRRTTRAVIAAYTNDDPFAPHWPTYYWRHFHASLPHVHHTFAYRTHNLTSYRTLGHNTSLLRSSYNPAHVNLLNLPRTTTVTFIGHWEPDGRDATLLHLLNNGIPLTLMGTLWEHSPLYPQLLHHLKTPPKPLYHQAYNQALNQARIALCFFSRKNRDTYTRRCFEIPAAGALLVSEHTDDLATLFTPDKEAVYFTNATDLLSKLQHLLANPKHLSKLAAAGHARLLNDGHTTTHRAQQILTDLTPYLPNAS